MVPTVSVLMGKKLLISYPLTVEINYIYKPCHVFAHVLVCSCSTYAKKQMINAIYGAVAAETHNLSLLYFLWYFKTGSHVLQNPSLYEEVKFVGRAQQICNRIKDKLVDKVK